MKSRGGPWSGICTTVARFPGHPPIDICLVQKTEQNFGGVPSQFRTQAPERTNVSKTSTVEGSNRNTGSLQFASQWPFVSQADHADVPIPQAETDSNLHQCLFRTSNIQLCDAEGHGAA